VRVLAPSPSSWAYPQPTLGVLRVRRKHGAWRRGSPRVDLHEPPSSTLTTAGALPGAAGELEGASVGWAVAGAASIGGARSSSAGGGAVTEERECSWLLAAVASPRPTPGRSPPRERSSSASIRTAEPGSADTEARCDTGRVLPVLHLPPAAESCRDERRLPTSAVSWRPAVSPRSPSVSWSRQACSHGHREGSFSGLKLGVRQN
jgi:hypothetical protein